MNVSTMESRVTPRKAAIRGKEKSRSRGTQWYHCKKPRAHVTGMPRKKYGVRGTEGQETNRLQTNVQDRQSGGTRGHRHSS